ncbi:hypothetical protein MRX96_003147 [Rhipicephalus microplus]
MRLKRVNGGMTRGLLFSDQFRMSSSSMEGPGGQQKQPKPLRREASTIWASSNGHRPVVAGRCRMLWLLFLYLAARGLLLSAPLFYAPGSLVISSFTHDILKLVVRLGVVYGMGVASTSIVPAVLIIHHFDKYRATALAIVSGSVGHLRHDDPIAKAGKLRRQRDHRVPQLTNARRADISNALNETPSTIDGLESKQPGSGRGDHSSNAGATDTPCMATQPRRRANMALKHRVSRLWYMHGR